MNVYNIPEHKNCTNCGRCCGLIPATPDEIKEIRAYVSKHKIKAVNIRKMTCPFRDDKKKICLIYPVRPMICRLMGVVKGMECPNGNTCELDGRKFLPKPTPDLIKKKRILNFLEWL